MSLFKSFFLASDLDDYDIHLITLRFAFFACINFYHSANFAYNSYNTNLYFRSILVLSFSDNYPNINFLRVANYLDTNDLLATDMFLFNLYLRNRDANYFYLVNINFAFFNRFYVKIQFSTLITFYVLGCFAVRFLIVYSKVDKNMGNNNISDTNVSGSE